MLPECERWKEMERDGKGWKGAIAAYRIGAIDMMAIDGLGSGLRFCVDGRHGVSYPPSSPCGMSPRNITERGSGILNPLGRYGEIEFDEFCLFEKLSQALAALAFLICCTLRMFSPPLLWEPESVFHGFGDTNSHTPRGVVIFLIMLHGWWGLGRVGQ